MPPLPQRTLRRLSAYSLSRDGVDLSHTAVGALSNAACWSWACVGDYQNVNDGRSANTIIDAVMNINTAVNPPVLVGFNDLRAFYPGTDAEFNALGLHVAPAIAGTVASQSEVAKALMGIIARANGLPVIAGAVGLASPYTLHLKSRSWFGWDHWGIGVLQTNGVRMFIQTVTGVPIAIACNVMWDEALPEYVLGLAGLNQAHLDVLRDTPLAPVRSARCVVCSATHGYFSSWRNHWHRCRQCGTVYCHAHVPIGGVIVGRSSRQCNQGGCPGRTEVVA